MKRSVSLSYRKKLDDLTRKCRNAGIKITFVPGCRLRDFAGMNDEASKKFGFHKMPDDSILIDRDMPVKMQYRNLIHEVEEMIRMEKLGGSYWHSHLAALHAETQGLSGFVEKKLEEGI